MVEGAPASRTSISLEQEDGLWVLELCEAMSGQRVRILPEIGATLAEYSVGLGDAAVHVLDPPPDLRTVAKEPMRWGCPILFPFPNRIRNGGFEFEGSTYTFTESMLGGHHIHGLVYNRPWRLGTCEAGPAGAMARLELCSADHPDLEEQYPFPFRISVAYILTPFALSISVDIHNTGSAPMPVGFGLHPYFRLPLDLSGSREACRVSVPAKERWELEDCIPTGRVVPVSGSFDLREGQPLDGLKLDDVFTNLDRVGETPVQCVLEDTEAGIQTVIELSPVFREVVVYTPPERSSVCIEPYTCATDAPNLHARGIDAGLRVLAPGERLLVPIHIRVEDFEATLSGL